MSVVNKNIAVVIIVVAAGMIFQSFWASLIAYGAIVLVQAFVDQSNSSTRSKK